MEAQDIQSAHEIQSVLEATHLNGQTSEEALESGLLTDSALRAGLAPSASSIALQAMGAPSAGGGVPNAAQPPGQAGIRPTREAGSTPQESSSLLLLAEYIMQQANGPGDSTPPGARRHAQHADSSARAAPGAEHQAGRPPPQAASAAQASNGFISDPVSMAHQAGSAMQPAGSGASPAHSPMQQRCFTEELVGVKACFQLTDLGRQIYVWAGTDSGAMGCMCLASPPQATGSHAGHAKVLCLYGHMSRLNTPLQRWMLHSVFQGPSVVWDSLPMCKAALATKSCHNQVAAPLL